MSKPKSPPPPRVEKPSETRAKAKVAKSSAPSTTAEAPSPKSQSGDGNSNFKPSNVRDISEFPDFADAIEPLAAESAELAIKIKPDADRREEIADELKVLIEAAGHNSLRGPTWVAVRSPGSTPDTIDPKLLLAEGVGIDVIERCTVPGKKYWKVTVTARKAK